MHTFAAKQKPTQEAKSTNFARPGQAFFGQGREVSLILNSQRSIENHTAGRLLQARIQELEEESRISAFSRFGHGFSRMSIHADSRMTFQPKLQVNTPGDIHEQEAERVAEQVMRLPEPQLQRACAWGGGCSSCQSEQAVNGHLQSKRVEANDTAKRVASPFVREVLHSSGQPLDSSTREFMEQRFGYDFSPVRVHTDSRAAESAQAVNAIAYTVGRNVVFGLGHYEPASTQGRRLLAHELTHVVQQGERCVPSRLVVGHSRGRRKQESEMLARGALEISSAQYDASEVRLQRAPVEEGTTNTGGGGQSDVPDCGSGLETCKICFDRDHVEWAKGCAEVSKNGDYIYVDSAGHCYRAVDPDDFKRDRLCPSPYNKAKQNPDSTERKIWPGGNKKKKR